MADNTIDGKNEEQYDNEEYALTDIYGREIVDGDAEGSYFQTVDSEADTEHDFNFTHVPSTLDAPLKPRRKKHSKEDQVILSYAETLHRGLKIMWVPMVYCGRMPFRLLLKNNRASIKVNKTSPAYISCFTMCILTWILFIWTTLGMLVIVGTSSGTFQNEESLEISLARRFWSDTFIFWTTLLQAVVSSTHILYQAEDFAMFIKAWYRVLDITKIEVSRTLKQYIITSQITLCIFILGVIIIFCLPSMFIGFRGTTWMIVISFFAPLKRFGGLKEPLKMDGKHYFQRYAAVGLLVYLIAIIFSWMYIMQFMVFCRCFRKGLKCINQRIAMILNVDDVPRVGPNALRLTYEFIHKDYLGIATTGIKIGRIFSWTICNYYLWAILVLVVELGEIFRFAKRNYHSSGHESFNHTSKTNSLEKIDIPLPVQHVVKDLLHFLVTAICIFYVSYEGSGAHKESKMSYELARYKGLVDCPSQLERNFIRSIWIIVSEKCPVHVAPGKFFGITHSTVMTVFATAFTYFVFWAQSQGQFVSNVDLDE